MSDTLDKMRKGLKAAQELELPMDADFFENLHDKIMAQVSETIMEPVSPLRRPKRLLRAHWREWIYPAGGTMALVFAVSLILSHFGKLQSGRAPLAKLNASGEKVVAAVIDFPDSIGQTLISSQSENDFFVDVASHSIENLSVSQFNKIMGRARR